MHFALKAVLVTHDTMKVHWNTYDISQSAVRHVFVWHMQWQKFDKREYGLEILGLVVTLFVFMGYIRPYSWAFLHWHWRNSMRYFIRASEYIIKVPDSKVHGANMGPSGAGRTQMGPMLARCTLLSGVTCSIKMGRCITTTKHGFVLTSYERLGVISPATRLFVYHLMQSNIKKLDITGPLYGNHLIPLDSPHKGPATAVSASI